MRNVVASASKDAYDFVPFTTFARRPGTCRLNDDRGAATYPLGHEELQAEVVHQFGGERLELVGESTAMMSDFHPSGFRAMA
jgi:hypothetical protein